MNTLLNLFKLSIFILISNLLISCGASYNEQEPSNIEHNTSNKEHNSMEIFKLYAIKNGESDAPRVSDYHVVKIKRINYDNLYTANELVAGADKESILAPMDIEVLLCKHGVICNTPTPTPTPTPTSMPSLNKKIWVKPSKSVCEDNGGRYVNDECDSSWHSATVICNVQGDKLPIIRDLKEVVVECNGTVHNYDKNKHNSSYQTCYKKRGFTTLNSYWSSTTVSSDMSRAWVLYFYQGNDSWINKTRKRSVRCIRERALSKSTPTPTPIVIEEVNQSKWIKPSQTICENNGGNYSNNRCTANWEKSKVICSTSGDSLPTIERLRAVVTDCHKANKTYTDCYKEKGFTPYIYWSSTSTISTSSLANAWTVGFYSGNDGWSEKSDEYHVQCLKKEISATRTTSIPKLEEEVEYNQWIKPSQSICERNGGEYDNECRASWENAKIICDASGDALPTIETLKVSVSDCGGETEENSLDESARNRDNKEYQTCYKKQGFSSNRYWSSITYMADSSRAWYVNFYSGYNGWRAKRNKSRVRCIRGGE